MLSTFSVIHLPCQDTRPVGVEVQKKYRHRGFLGNGSEVTCSVSVWCRTKKSFLKNGP